VTQGKLKVLLHPTSRFLINMVLNHLGVVHGPQNSGLARHN
jgi:hypothetical protein